MFHHLLDQSIINIQNRNYELALLSIMPLFDKACSKTWPKKKVGERFRLGVKETEDIITFIMSNCSCVFKSCKYGDLTLDQIIYKYLRNDILHEGKMPDNIKLIDESKLICNKTNISLPKQLVLGLLVAAIGFECYKKEIKQYSSSYQLVINQRTLSMSNLTGNHQTVRDIIKEKGFAK